MKKKKEEEDENRKHITHTGASPSPINKINRKPSAEAVDRPTRYDSDFGVIDTHYYVDGKDQQPEGRNGPGVTKAEEQKRAATLREARAKMTTQTNCVTTAAEGGKGRNVYVVRNGERLDRLFPEWLELGFNQEGKYRPYDLNHPLVMPRRPGGKEEFRDDSPITEIGYCTAQMVGRAIHLTKVSFTAIYTSPALRCVQTAHGILKTLSEDDTVKVEPGLFEFTGWYKNGIPKWLTPAELKRAGYRVEVDYKPVYSVAEITKGETGEEHHERVAKLVKRLLEKATGNILIVGHGTTMDGVARHLLGFKSKDINHKTMDSIGAHYPYSSTVALREKDGSWKVVQDALPPVLFSGFSSRVKTNFLIRP